MSKSILLTALLALSLMAPVVAHAQEKDQRWVVLVISGSWQDSKEGFSSEPMLFPGRSACNGMELSTFVDRAKRGFWKHIEAEYPGNFPYSNIYNNVRALPLWGTTSRNEIREIQTSWVAEERNSNRRVTRTSYSLSCD